MSTQISYSFTVADSFSENSKVTNLCVSPSFALSTKKHTVSHCVFTHLLRWFCTMSIYPSWNYISPNSHPAWLLVKKGLREKFAQDLEDTSEVRTLKVATKRQALWQFIPGVPRVLAHGEGTRPTVPPAGSPPPVSSSPACLSAQSCRLFVTPWTIAHQAPL